MTELKKVSVANEIAQKAPATIDREAIIALMEEAMNGGYFEVKTGIKFPEFIEELREAGYRVKELPNKTFVISWKDVPNPKQEDVFIYEEGTNTFDDAEKDFVLSGKTPEGSKVVVAGKSAVLNGFKPVATVTNVTVAEDFEMTNTHMSGAYVKATMGNAMMSVHADGDVVIKNSTINPDVAYNGIEIGLTNGTAKFVLIENCKFEGAFSNNAINVFGVEENAVITIKDCSFKSVSNMLRLSNRTNVPFTVNIENCSVEEWTTGEYSGAVLCQDYTSKGAENQFGEGKVKINFINLKTPNGMLANVPAEKICGTKKDSQIVYVYAGEFVDFDADKYPVITIK